MLKPLFQKRVLVCTFIALASALFGAYVGREFSWTTYSQQCEAGIKRSVDIPGAKHLCQAWATPGAILQGSTTGIWTGMILGAFVGGLATRKNN